MTVRNGRFGPRPSRRDYVRLVGAGSLAAVGGCLGGSDEPACSAPGPTTDLVELLPEDVDGFTRTDVEDDLSLPAFGVERQVQGTYEGPTHQYFLEPAEHSTEEAASDMVFQVKYNIVGNSVVYVGFSLSSFSFWAKAEQDAAAQPETTLARATELTGAIPTLSPECVREHNEFDDALPTPS